MAKAFRSRELPGHQLTIQVAPGRLHRLRRVRRRLPRARTRPRSGTRRINMRPSTSTATSSGSAGTYFLDDPRARPHAVAHDSVKSCQLLAAAVRVLRRLRRMRRDALPQAADPAVRRPDLVIANATGCSSIYGGNLPTTPWVDERRRPRPGVGQLAVRGQRRVRARPAARHRAAANATARRLVDELAAIIGDELAARAARRHAQPTRPSIAAQRDAGRAAAALAWRGRRRPRARRLRRSPTTLVRPERLDRRRRRLGLRHRLRRPRPRAGQRTQRQPARARHRGLLEHRRPGVEGHAARRRRQVRHRRQADRPRRTSAPIGQQLRQRLRRPGRDRRPATSRRSRRCWRPRPGPGRRWSSPTHLHRPRHRHGDLDDPSEGRRAVAATGRSTATGPAARGARAPVPARLAAPDVPFRDFAMQRGSLRHARSHRPGARRRADLAGPGRRRRALALLRAARRRRAHRPHTGHP